MTVKESLRVGLVGCGEVAQSSHIPSLLRIRNVEVAAACDKDEELAKRVAKRFHINNWYADFPDMLHREKLDIIDICTPPGIHATLSIEAMEAGCHVLVEKPVASSVKEADEMASASKRNQVKLCVVHDQLFEPVMVKAKSIIGQGGTGDLRGIDIRISLEKGKHGIGDKDHWYHELPGGVFGELLPHPIYLATAFLGHLEPIAVYSSRFGSHDRVVVDELRVILEGEKGVATINSSCNSPTRVNVLHVFGTKMDLHIDIFNSIISIYPGRVKSRLSRPILEDFRRAFQQISQATSRSLKLALGTYHTGHYTLIRGFIESIQNATEPPVTIEEGIEVMRVYEKITAQIDSKGRI